MPDALCDLVPFMQFKKREKHPWRSVNFNKVAGINDVNGEEIVRMFYEVELQKTNQKEFRIGKVIKRKSDKLHVKWKGYDN